MAYVNVPKDLTKVKTKVLFNLTKRQLICFGSGALIGVPLFFLLKGSIGTSPAAMVMMVVMIPAMLFAMYEKNGQPLEVVIRNIYRVCFQRPKQRPYKTNNFYAVLERQNQLDREVYQIVRKEKAISAISMSTSKRAISPAGPCSFRSCPKPTPRNCPTIPLI